MNSFSPPLPCRREFLKTTSFLGTSALLAPLAFRPQPLRGEESESKQTQQGFQVHVWQRDVRNPIFPPGPGAFDVGACMNPWIIVKNDEYWLFYAGADKRGHRRICLATTPRDNLAGWKRHGPLFDLGGKGSFDETWCVIPCVHRLGDKWHMYYTGRSADVGVGLQGFRGIGLAVSDDLRNWKKVSTDPVLLGDGFPDWPKNKGIAGAGSILEIPQPDGKTLYRMHYTLATGTPGKDLLINQAKQAVMAETHDGRTWFHKRVMLRPRLEATYENAAVIALNLWKTKTRWRAIYAGIGTRFGAYSICEAFSPDGETWQRGKPGENLALPPTGTGWESKMTEYPHVVREHGKLRLFYCGNGYGATGIGTAIAEPLD